jgi:hypothetical protein
MEVDFLPPRRHARMRQGCVWGTYVIVCIASRVVPLFRVIILRANPTPVLIVVVCSPPAARAISTHLGILHSKNEVEGEGWEGWWQRSGVLLVVQDRLPAARHTCHARQCHQCERHQGTCKSQRPPRGLQTPHFRRGVVSSLELDAGTDNWSVVT